jgi:naphthoate synthase
VTATISELFDPTVWKEVPGFEGLQDLTYHRHTAPGRDGGIVRVAFDRPEVRNAFRPGTVDELYRVLDHARMSPDVGCVLLTGNGPSPKDGGWAFCSAATSASAAAPATSTPAGTRRRRSTRRAQGGCTSSRCSA